MKKEFKNDNITCPDCDYHNHKDAIEKFGTCKRCGKTLNAKAKYNYEMFCRLRLWRKN